MNCTHRHIVLHLFVIFLGILTFLTFSVPFFTQEKFSETSSIYFKTEDIWAVLVAGSKGYENYRHQADVAATYQTLRDYGINKERIVVMMYDDVVNCTENPFPGKLFNQPGGADVYAGLRIDYSQQDVNWANLQNILLGDKDSMNGIGSGRVLESDGNSHILFYYVDHGAIGLVGLIDEIINTHQILNTFERMKSRRLFNRMVFLLEACFSGSIVENIGDDLNVLGISASGRNEYSYATFCKNDLNTCLADEFTRVVLNSLHKDSISARDVDLLLLIRNLATSTNQTQNDIRRADMGIIIEARRAIDSLMISIVGEITSEPAIQAKIQGAAVRHGHDELYFEIIALFSEQCVNFTKNTYAFRYTAILYNICGLFEKERIKGILRQSCRSNKTAFTF